MKVQWKYTESTLKVHWKYNESTMKVHWKLAIYCEIISDITVLLNSHYWKYGLHLFRRVWLPPPLKPTPHCVSLYMLKKKCCYSKLRCRVWESNPPANILWFLDGQRILDQGKTVAWNKTRKKKNKFSLNFQSIYIAGIWR